MDPYGVQGLHSRQAGWRRAAADGHITTWSRISVFTNEDHAVLYHNKAVLTALYSLSLHGHGSYLITYMYCTEFLDFSLTYHMCLLR